MKNKKNVWLILGIIIAILLLSYWLIFSPRAESRIDRQGQDVIEDLTID